jgi:predicted metal-dependent peptidase
MAKLTPQQRLERAHIQLMRSPEFARLSGIMMLGESKIKSGVPTAYTDGVNKVYGEEFMQKLDEKEFNFVVAHENFHVLFKHLTTWRHLDKIDPKLTNAACDYVINLMIADLDPSNKLIAFPKIGLLYDPMFRGWDTGQVFKYLQQKVEEKQQQPQPQPQQQQGDQQCDNQGDQQGDGTPQERGPVDAEEFTDNYAKGKANDAMDEHDWVNANDLPADQREAIEKAIDQAIRQGDILAGKLGGGTNREIGALPEPKVDWREQLRDFVTSVTAGRDASTWRKPSRRWLADNIYMPSPYSEAVGPVVIGVDTSASISPDEIASFLAEIKSIATHTPPERIHLLYWDTVIAGEETYLAGEYDSLEQSTKPAGGGGTDPRCVEGFVYKMSPKPEFVLMLSDGYVVDWPNFGVPTMWAMTTDQTAPNAVNIRL